jgi:hypothetical protein
MPTSISLVVEPMRELARTIKGSCSAAYSSWHRKGCHFCTCGDEGEEEAGILHGNKDVQGTSRLISGTGIESRQGFPGYGSSKRAIYFFCSNKMFSKT